MAGVAFITSPFFLFRVTTVIVVACHACDICGFVNGMVVFGEGKCVLIQFCDIIMSEGLFRIDVTFVASARPVAALVMTADAKRVHYFRSRAALMAVGAGFNPLFIMVLMVTGCAGHPFFFVQ